MRLPWVSRAHYELLEHNFREQSNEWRVQRAFHAEDRKRYDSLLEKFCAMKLAGGVIVDTPAPIERKEQDEVTRRLNILSVGRPGLRAQMLRQVESDRTLHGMSDIAILQRIEAGVTADEGIPA